MKILSKGNNHYLNERNEIFIKNKLLLFKRKN
jgi:hypothetical protein